MQTAIVLGDVQSPYHDPRAWAVAMEIGRDLKPDVLVMNGDFGDYWNISLRFPRRREARKAFVATLAEEIPVTRGLVKEAMKTIRPKRALWNDGNHEFRVLRALIALQQVAEIAGLPEVQDAVSIPSLMHLDELGVKYSGEYPNGTWLWGSVKREHDVWVEHGYMTRRHSGYMATALIQDRMASVITGHVERLACVWKRVVGNVWHFGVEGGNLSKIGEPGIGDGIYSTYPFNVADLMNRQQGIVCVYRDGNDNFPELVPIKSGRAIWRGRVYKG